MKNVVRVFCLLIVGIAVFLGALLISEGLKNEGLKQERQPGAQPAQAASGAEEDASSREKVFRSIEQSSEGSAL